MKNLSKPDWSAMVPIILPSMLQCDFGNLSDEVSRLEAAGATALHLDVMDGVFVPNLSYGIPLVESFRKLTRLPLDVHLMIVHPEKYIQRYRDAGADSLTFHIEATDDPEPILHEIRDSGAAVGLALNPKTPISRIQPYLSLCDLALVMSVEAGFGGQKFDSIALDKIKTLRELRLPRLQIEVDGGINSQTIQSCKRAGADMFVVGSAIFGRQDYKGALGDLFLQLK